MYNKLNRLFKNGSIYEAFAELIIEKELVKMMNDLIDFIGSAKSNGPDEDADIRSAIDDKKNKILSHPKFEEFKKEGFHWQDETIKLSDWYKNLARAASLYLENRKYE